MIRNQKIDKIPLKEAYQYCQDVTHRGGPHFSVGFRFLPPPKRNAIYAIYAFCRYADDIVDEAQALSPDVVLKEWEEELLRCYRQEPTHPISIALADAILRYPIPIQGFLDLIAGCRMDLTLSRYPTFDALMVYCHRVATTIRDLSLPVFGYSDPTAFEYGQSLSTALQLTNIVRDIGEDLDRGRIYLPLDEICACGYSEQELMSRAKNAAFLKLMEFQCQRIRVLFQKSAFLVPLVDADARTALSLMREVYIALIDKIEQNPFDVLDCQIRLSWIERCTVVVKQIFKKQACLK
jgi:phytoene synthase